MRLIKATDQRQMPWKNGGGTTTEVALSPPGATTLDFDWRVSMARIEADGAFSEFPDIDRSLSILEGDGITLSSPGSDHIQLTKATPPYTFAADIPIFARRRGGSVVDLNVMTRRGVFHSKVTRLSVTSSAVFTLGADVTLFFCYAGPLTIQARHETYHAAPRDCAIFEAPGSTVTIQRADGQDVFMIELTRA